MSRDGPKTTDYCATCGESPDSGSHLPGGHAYAYPDDREPWRDYLNGLTEVGDRYPLTEQELDAIADGAARTHTLAQELIAAAVQLDADDRAAEIEVAAMFAGFEP